MEGALIILGVTVLVGIVLYVHHRLTGGDSRMADDSIIPSSDNSVDSVPEVGEEGSDADGEVCCGMHLVCEKTSLSPVSADVEYYDDEELDRFRGREADSYTDEETDEFLDVLLTMRPEDVAGWSRSLQLRSITPPVSVRDNILMIVSEQRTRASEAQK